MTEAPAPRPRFVTFSYAMAVLLPVGGLVCAVVLARRGERRAARDVAALSACIVLAFSLLALAVGT